ncbi:hypothetical protein EZ449_03525 [Pedobacter frigidisoli]|uniref:Uncharacterized protein n=1 Tax=Pedobacter frigidisoli TaxID=2530455 RepID=A0A4R0P8U3_9SPHI|nr:hypothetical protein [Pedobacter frigidisoli]TCD12100.1 hypothetical protein EZ449_03525 [Pedobacter frigidisoli]
MEMHSPTHDLSFATAEANNSNTTKNEQHIASEGIERISQALWKAINNADEDDASLWKMWR